MQRDLEKIILSAQELMCSFQPSLRQQSSPQNGSFSAAAGSTHEQPSVSPTASAKPWAKKGGSYTDLQIVRTGASCDQLLWKSSRDSREITVSVNCSPERTNTHPKEAQSSHLAQEDCQAASSHPLPVLAMTANAETREGDIKSKEEKRGKLEAFGTTEDLALTSKKHPPADAHPDRDCQQRVGQDLGRRGTFVKDSSINPVVDFKGAESEPQSPSSETPNKVHLMLMPCPVNCDS